MSDEDEWYKIIGWDPDTKSPKSEKPAALAEKRPKKTKAAPKTKGVRFIEVTIHKFKSNIAYYMRECEEGRIDGVVLKRYDRRVGFYTRYDIPGS